MPLIWTKPTFDASPSFAMIGTATVGYVTHTARADGLLLATVLPRGPDRRGFIAYVATEAKGKAYVERWLKHHMPDTSTWRKPGKMPHEGAE